MRTIDLPANGSGSSLVLAARWIETALLGTAATLVAIIAVAAVGYMLLTGRVDLRRGATVVIGCFILFGAREIAAALHALAATDASPGAIESTPSEMPPLARNPATESVPARTYDPYAGASVPNE